MDHVVGLDLEDLTPRQLRSLLRRAAMAKLPSAKRRAKDENMEEECADDECEENSDAVDLHEEHTGDSKPPKVTRDDLPKGVTMPKTEGAKRTK